MVRYAQWLTQILENVSIYIQLETMEGSIGIVCERRHRGRE